MYKNLDGVSEKSKTYEQTIYLQINFCKEAARLKNG